MHRVAFRRRSSGVGGRGAEGQDGDVVAQAIAEAVYRSTEDVTIAAARLPSEQALYRK